MKRLFQVTATIGAASVFAIVLKMVGAKIVASALGTSGMGIYAQLVLVADLGTTVASMGLAAGIIRYASEFRSSESWTKLGGLETTLLFILLPFSLLIAAGVVVFSPDLSTVILGRSSYAPAVAIIALSLPLAVLAGIAETLTNAAKEFRFRAVSLIVNAVAGLALLAPLAWSLGVLGAGIALSAAAVLRAGVAWFFSSRLKPKRSFRSVISLKNVESAVFGKLFHYGAASLTSGAVLYASALLVRTSIVSQLGVSANGVYQVVWASQTSWLPVLFAGYYSYFYPSYCEAKNPEERCEQINKVVRFMVLLSTPVLGIFMLFRSEVVLVLYTPQFLPAVPLLGVSLLYGPVSVLAFCLTVPLLAAGRLRASVALNLFQQSTFVLGSFILLPAFALDGVVYSAGIASILATLGSLAYMRWRLGIALSASNARALALSVSLVAIVFPLSELPRVIGILSLLVLLLAWLHQVLDRSEVAAIREIAFTRARTLLIGT